MLDSLSRAGQPAPSGANPGPRRAGIFASAACVAGFAALALAIMWQRWGGTIEDSLHYFNTARYLRGEVAFDVLQAPFPYRIAVPALAAALPGDVRNNFALLNWLFVTAAAGLTAWTALRLGFGRRYAVVGGLLLIASVPTYWYAPYLLVDPGSVCARAAFVLALVSGQPWLAAAAGVAGTAIREENILLLAWLMAWPAAMQAVRRRGLRDIAIAALPGAAGLALAGAWILAVRFWLVTGLPGYTWSPSWARVAEALHDVRSLASIALAAGLVLPLALAGMRRAARHTPRQPQARPDAQSQRQLQHNLLSLKTLLALMALPALYAALCVRVDGRIIWGLYPFLMPFALCAIRHACAKPNNVAI